MFKIGSIFIPALNFIFAFGMFMALFFLHKDGVGLHLLPDLKGFGILPVLIFTLISIFYYRHEKNTTAMRLMILALPFIIGWSFIY